MSQSTDELVREVKEVHAQMAQRDMLKVYPLFPMLFKKTRTVRDGFNVYMTRVASYATIKKGEGRWSAASMLALQLKSQWDKHIANHAIPVMIIRCDNYNITPDYDVSATLIDSGALVGLLANGWNIRVE